MWLRRNYLLIATIFLLIFIPLYPKIPAVHVIRTWVYIRLEDFFVAFAIGLLLFAQFRKKQFFPKSVLTVPILIYWAIGLISLVWSLSFIGPKLLNYFPHLAILHYLRRIEYMLLFFVAFVSISSNKKQGLGLVVWALVLTVIAIVIYGVGQKFLGWPAFLTMNEEFAKGIPLRLPPTARIPSTFGGHYDLAAYIVLVIPILGSLVFSVKGFLRKILLILIAISALVLLLFTASRISFGVYLVTISVMLLFHKKPLLIMPVVIVSFMLLNSVSGASERFYKTFRMSDVIVDLSTGQPIGTLEKLEGGTATVEKQESPAEEELPKGSGFIGVSSHPPSNHSTKTIKAIELYGSKDLATGSGEIATVSGSFLIQKALVYDISITTRFQGQWPKAITAWKRNIFLGSGFSTLSVASDGDYLRMLGETGVLGAISFLGILATLFWMFIKTKDKLQDIQKAFVVGVMAGIVGLLFNAILIDVFEASKVAYSLWLFVGVAVAVMMPRLSVSRSYFSILKGIFTSRSAFVVYLVIIIWYVFGSSINQYFIGDDFTWLRWAAETRLVDVRGFFTHSNGFFYRPIPKLWFSLMYSVFWLKPMAYHVVLLSLYIMSVLCIYGIMTLIGIPLWMSWIFACLYGVLSIHHENVFWISGISSVLGSTFFFGSLFSFIYSWTRAKRRNRSIELIGLLLLALSMGSYEGSIVFPVIVTMCAFVLLKTRNIWYLAVLFYIPTYWWMRTNAGAIQTAGDYAINTSKILPNFVSNGAGYMLAVFAGPGIIEQFESLRSMFRSQVVFVSSLSVLTLGLIIGSLVIVRKRLSAFKISGVMFLSAGVSILPYLGLGGMAERYVLVFSGLIVIGLATMIAQIAGKKMSLLYAVCVFVLVSVIGSWNIREIQKLDKEWQKSSDIVQQTLLIVKKRYFPLTSSSTFIFVNTPIRYGRAWIFPTGLTDAMWHMFKFNGFAYYAVNVNSIKEAYAHPYNTSAVPRLVFEDFVLREAQMEVKYEEEQE